MSFIWAVVIFGLLGLISLFGLGFLFISPKLKKKEKKKLVFKTEQEYKLDIEAIAKKRQLDLNFKEESLKYKKTLVQIMMLNKNGSSTRGRI